MSSAYIIGNGESRKGFDLSRLPSPTFACNAIYRDFHPTVLISVDNAMREEIESSNYTGRHIHNSSSGTNSGNTAIRLAIDESYKNIYLLGFDLYPHSDVTEYIHKVVKTNNLYKGTKNYRPEEARDATWRGGLRILTNIISKHKNIKFIHVGGLRKVPSEWNGLKNLKFISYLELEEEL